MMKITLTMNTMPYTEKSKRGGWLKPLICLGVFLPFVGVMQIEPHPVWIGLGIFAVWCVLVGWKWLDRFG